ncbi:MAG TPA: hypothetical protein VJ183_10370 [Chloroflexia bacterium]|nr:hypothetical protein [Chloroflexia bacterium]
MATMFERNPRVEEAFSEASRQVMSGRTIEAVLEQFPQHAEELEALLRLNLAIRAVPSPALSSEALERIREQLHATTQEQPATVDTRTSPAQEVNRPQLLPEHRSWLDKLLQAPRRKLMVVVPMMAVLAVLVLVVTMALLRQSDTRSPLEHYSGVITRIEGNEWLIGDDTEVVIDSSTEIHGQPAVGAQMSCIAERLPGLERYRALEIWIHEGPGTPIVAPESLPSRWHATRF